MEHIWNQLKDIERNVEIISKSLEKGRFEYAVANVKGLEDRAKKIKEALAKKIESDRLNSI